MKKCDHGTPILCLKPAKTPLQIQTHRPCRICALCPPAASFTSSPLLVSTLQLHCLLHSWLLMVFPFTQGRLLSLLGMVSVPRPVLHWLLVIYSLMRTFQPIPLISLPPAPVTSLSSAMFFITFAGHVVNSCMAFIFFPSTLQYKLYRSRDLVYLVLPLIFIILNSV